MFFHFYNPESVLPMQCVFQFLATVFLAFSFDELAIRIYNIKDHVLKRLDGCKLKVTWADNTSFDLSDLKKVYTQRAEDDFRVIRWPSLVGLAICIVFLLVTGLCNISVACNDWCLWMSWNPWIFVVVLAPLVISYLFIFGRTERQARRFEKALDYINDRYDYYTNIVLHNQIDIIDDKEFRMRFDKLEGTAADRIMAIREDVVKSFTDVVTNSGGVVPMKYRLPRIKLFLCKLHFKMRLRRNMRKKLRDLIKALS